MQKNMRRIKKSKTNHSSIVSSHLDYYRNSKTGYTPCYYKNGKKISYDAYKKAVKSFWTGKELTFAKIN